MQIKINKHSAYAPIRYEATRPYAAPLGRAFMVEDRKGEKERISFVQKTLLPMLSAAASKIGRQNGPGPLQAEITNVQIFGSYQDQGRVIFDMSRELTTALLLTDADEIPCGEIVLPVQGLYLHFGSIGDLIHDGLSIEGAFVHRNKNRLIISLAPSGFGRRDFLSMPKGDGLVNVPIDVSDPAKPIIRALSDSIAEILQHNKGALKQIEEIERQLTAQYGAVVKVPSSLEDLEDKEPLLKRATALIINALFYLASVPEDVVEDWGRDTPAEAVTARSNAVKPGEIRTIENTILKAGYSKVKFVGRGFANSTDAKAISDAIGESRSMPTHFRRGHYRQQPYGPEKSLRKRIFVAPVVVNASAGGEMQGRIYAVT